jgi:ubiquinone/menaquinone biosynthesis C-methylase UbiE
MKKTCLQLLPKSAEYAAATDNDPLRFYYWPVLGKLYRRRVELCLELLPGGERVLEVGFGSGVSFLNLSGLYREIYGLDLEADCQGVSACFAARGVTAQLINGSVLELPYPDNFFDAVLLISILEHLKPEDLNRACREIRRVLKPGGRMVYGVPVERPLMAAAFMLLGYDIREHHFSTEKEIAAAAGSTLSPVKTTHLRWLGGLAGPVYEARSYINDDHDNEARSLINDSHDN